MKRFVCGRDEVIELKVSLKSLNNVGLITVLAANILLFYGVVQGNTILNQDWTAVAKQADKVIPAALGTAIIGVLNGLLSPQMKARIVFVRWRNPLPGSRAFTEHLRHDSRIDVAALEKNFGPFPTEPDKQNALWYRLYRSVDEKPAVLHTHRSFLFARDYTCLALMLLLVLGTAGFVQIPATKVAIGYAAILLVQFLATSQAARNYGNRLVTSVLAIKSAQ